MILEQAFLADHDYYEILGLTADATQLEVEAAFKQLSAGLNLRHPDESERMRSAESMLMLTQAFETLSNPILRSHYDIQVLGRQNLPVNEKVDTLFKEGIRAWRKQETELALRYLKEVAHLYPHRPLYRVHLAIAYAEKDWYTFTESELETALRLDPDFKFAKETVAKLLFKMPDKRRRWYHDRLIRRIGPMAAGFVLLGVLIAAGIPQGLFGNLLATVMDSAKSKPKAENVEQQLPEDMRKELAQKQTSEQIEIPFFESDYRPEGQVYDYDKLEAKEKVYYPDQKMVVITYSDGSILTYRPTELKGWKKHPKTGVPIMITANHEMIPSPPLALKLPGNVDANLSEPGFPIWLFPEYGKRDQTVEASANPDAASAAPASSAGSAGPGDTVLPTAAPDTASAPVPTEVPGSIPAYNPYGGQ
ncbi:MAG: hypothetical protein CVV27_08065 [Candidatus Melainabacteria bacterium HGW-Melainabacteria-1]|nr:MAG: hypothetical protein CVV27_08065 [Candidatus Melainabacteria bacterium HGW-Melainabacteria-1]